MDGTTALLPGGAASSGSGCVWILTDGDTPLASSGGLCAGIAAAVDRGAGAVAVLTTAARVVRALSGGGSGDVAAAAGDGCDAACRVVRQRAGEAWRWWGVPTVAVTSWREWEAMAAAAGGGALRPGAVICDAGMTPGSRATAAAVAATVRAASVPVTTCSAVSRRSDARLPPAGVQSTVCAALRAAARDGKSRAWVWTGGDDDGTGGSTHAPAVAPGGADHVDADIAACVDATLAGVPVVGFDGDDRRRAAAQRFMYYLRGEREPSPPPPHPPPPSVAPSEMPAWDALEAGTTASASFNAAAATLRRGGCGGLPNADAEAEVVTHLATWLPGAPHRAQVAATAAQLVASWAGAPCAARWYWRALWCACGLP